MKRYKPIYGIKFRHKLTKPERLEIRLSKLRFPMKGSLSTTRLRKPMCPMKDSLYDDPFKVSNPSIDHSIIYEKFVMNKYIKMENALE